VLVAGKRITKPGFFVAETTEIKLEAEEQYVSRAGLKLASVAQLLGLDFRGKTVLDVGSSTGGFTDYSLRHGAKKVYAVDVGTNQLHPSLRQDKRIELHEKTDIRDFTLAPLPSFDAKASARRSLDAGPASRAAPSSHASGVAQRGTPSAVTRGSIDLPDIIVIDVSFISLREILPHIARELTGEKTQIAAMVKPQFEAGYNQTNRGVIKNDSVRRKILQDFETWAKNLFVINDKRDSDVAGAKGNRERF
jgi:23S rRNA (cytidine1920-2'-O)/16S rRNA (cytidine1409-2'-O)-methyltransferase